ncbi:MAG TPA: alpha/beta hydrolase [Fimbriimonadaceae bacterium]|nr:alpha/beta hydrolase [Fimbriimonadaceae bacterium]
MLASLLVLSTMVTTISVDRGAYSITAEAIGSGKPVVAIAGGPGFSGNAVWGIGFGARERCRTYLFNQLGTGSSKLKNPDGELASHVSLEGTVQDLEALRKRVGAKKWTVVGQSWGVIVALVYAATHPTAIDHLVLTSVPGIGAEGFVLGKNLDRIVPSDVMKTVLDLDLQTGLSEPEKIKMQVATLMPYYFIDAEMGKQTAERAPKDMFNPNVFIALRKNILNPSGYEDLISRLPKVFKSPVTMIQGHQDPCGSAMPFLLKEKFLPQAKVELLDSCGHFGWIEDRQMFFHAYLSALKVPLPPYLAHPDPDENPAWQRELEAMKKNGWPFGHGQ